MNRHNNRGKTIDIYSKTLQYWAKNVRHVNLKLIEKGIVFKILLFLNIVFKYD